MMKSWNTARAAAIALALAAATGSARAADILPLAAPAEPALAYVADNYWDGFYAGVFAGRNFVGADGSMGGSYNGGLKVGYTQQYGNFVVGGELEGTYDNKQDYLLPGGGVLRQNWSGAAKAKAGVAFDQVLLYGTAGVGLAYLETEGTVTSPDKWVYGLTFGGGVEVGITDNISANLEYTQARYTGVESVIAGVSRKDDLTTHAVRAGVNFHF